MAAVETQTGFVASIDVGDVDREDRVGLRADELRPARTSSDRLVGPGFRSQRVIWCMIMGVDAGQRGVAWPITAKVLVTRFGRVVCF
jgi:hypothetical protein